MKKLFLLIQLIFSGCLGYAQTTGYIRNDTVKITNATKTATLVLETGSKNHGWYLKDIGNGRTQFVQAEISDINHLQDSLTKKANDINTIHKTGNETKNGNLTIMGTNGQAALTVAASGTGASAIKITNTGGTGISITSPSGGNSIVLNNTGGTALDVSGYAILSGGGSFDISKSQVNFNSGVDLTLFGPSASGRSDIKQLGTTGLRITQGGSANNFGLLLNNGTILDEIHNKYFLKQGDVLDSTSIIKKTFGVVHLATITAMQAYNDTATTIIVTDTLRGGIFNYNASLSKNDGGIYFTATGKGSGTWVREYNLSYGINFAWWGAVADYDMATHTGTDNLAAIQAALNSQTKRGGNFYLPGAKNGKYYGISGPIVIGQTTRIFGDAPSLPVQYNTLENAGNTDTITYMAPSVIYAYNGTGAIRSDTTETYRGQLPNIHNLTIVGTGKRNNSSGVDFLSNHNYMGVSTGADVGLGLMDNVYIDGFTTGVNLQKVDTYWMFQCHISNCQTGIRGGKQDLRIENTCLFDLDTAIVSSARNSTFSHNEIQPGDDAVGILLGGYAPGETSVTQHNIISENHIYRALQPIVLNNGAARNSITNNQLLATTAVNMIKLDSAGSYNSITGNRFSKPIQYMVYARKTGRLNIENNIFEDAPVGYAPYKLDTCLNVRVNNNYDFGYSTLNKFNFTGSSQEYLQQSSNTILWSSDDYNPLPGIYSRSLGGTFQNPTALLANRSLYGIHVAGHNGVGINERATIEAFTTEDWTSTANGTRWDFSITHDGTTSRQVRGTMSWPTNSNPLFYWNGDIKSTNLQLPLTGLLKGNGAGNNISAISGTSSQFIMGDGSLTNTSLLKYDGTALTTGVDILPSTNGTINLGNSALNFNTIRAQQLTYAQGSLQLNSSSPTGVILLKTNSVTNMQMFSNGNIALQNGDTFTDTGNKLQVNGTSYFNGNIGIGTSTPNYNIEAYNASNDVRIQATRGAGFAHIEANSSGGALALTDLTGATTVQFRTYGDSFFNGGKFGIGTTAPTNTLTLGATTSGIAYYNTTDQTTNYERMRQFWTNNVFNISTEMAGTGVGRNIKLSSGSSSFIIGSTTTGSSFEFRRDLTGFSTILNVTSTGLVGSSSQALILGDPVISQTESGAYSIFWANPTESTLGSGFHYLFRGSIAGTDKFTVDNTGKINSTSLSASQLVGTDAGKNLISLTVLPNGTTAATQTATDNSTKVATTAFVKAQGYGTCTVTANSMDVLTNKDLTSYTNTFPTFNQNTTGNAATATKLATARTINGVSFDGTADITIATTPAWADITGKPSFATVATSGAYSDLSGKPTNVSSFTNDAGYLTTSGVSAGTYTPTINDTLGTDTLEDLGVSSKWHYIKVGSEVHVTGVIDVGSSATSGEAVLELDLPVAASFGSVDDISGTAVFSNTETLTSVRTAAEVGFSTNGKPTIALQWSSVALGVGQIAVNYTYTIIN